MRHARKLILLGGTVGLVFVASVAQAGVLSINDLAESLALNVASFDQITHPGGPAPGLG
jgi:hypothetical protein